MKLLPIVLGLVSVLAPVGCQAQPQQAPQDADKVLAEVMEQFKKEGIVFDTKAETVSVPATVNSPRDPVEYLLIHKKGKRHEALFVTRSKPSVMNAALLMLGMTPGKNATYEEKKPAPTLEEVQKGVDPLIVTPPSGTPLWMTVRWKGADGKPVEHCVEDLIMDLSTQKEIEGARWVFLGGRMARLYKNDPEVYVADMEGNLVSICYLSPDNHLATMAHDNARDDQNWWMTPLLPPFDTEVEFVFHKKESKLHVEREKRLAKAAAEAKGADGKDEKPKDAGGK
ncbi:MAG: hypothetical protein JNK15_21845 [Planctomycetes bacterium]|nr:hypothetical protein [Planctomycetota bacterium]